jgi:hypothetical protein
MKKSYKRGMRKTQTGAIVGARCYHTKKARLQELTS